MLGTWKDLCALTDTELVTHTRQGCEEAFNILIKRHYTTCVNIATFILRDRGDAQDEVQKACCKAFEHLDQYQGEAEFLSWLLRIVSNQCLMLIRMRKRARFYYLDADTDRERSAPVELAEMTLNPEQQFIHCELLDVLRREICRIPPLLRNVLLLRDVQELAMPDVAARLHITVPAAKSRLLRARVELRGRVMRHCVSVISVKAKPRLPVFRALAANSAG